MYKLLITNEVILNEERLNWIVRELPDIDITYCKDIPDTKMLAEADFIFGRPEPHLLKHCKNLKFLQLRSAGADKYINGILPKEVVLATSGGALAHSVAEHMVGMLLAMMKHLDVYSRYMSMGKWEDVGPARTIVGSTTLILGLGSLGSEFAWRMKTLGSHVIGLRRAGKDKPGSVDELYLSDELDILLPIADIIANFLPATSYTENILNRRRLSLMKDDSFILNAGRGTTIEQDALCDLMDSGKFAGAALDVTVPEPLPQNHRLWKTPRVFITPHIAGTDHLSVTTDYIIKIAIENIKAYIKGGEIQSEIDYSTGYRKVPKVLKTPRDYFKEIKNNSR